MNKPAKNKPSASILRKIHSLRRQKGKMVAIEPISGRWFLGNNTVEALKKAKEEFPDRSFVVERVGYKAAGMLK